MEIDLSRFLIRRVTARIEETYRGLELRAVAYVGGFEGAETIQCRSELPSEWPHWHPQDRVAWVRKLVLDRILAHELTECLFVDGVRATDPHPEKPEYHQRTRHAIRGPSLSFVIDDPLEAPCQE